MIKRKNILLLGTIILIVGVIIALYLITNNYENRFGFKIPKNADVINLDKGLGITPGSLSIKFKLDADEIEDFIELIEDSDYYEFEDLEYIPHPENIVNNWDLNYDNIDTCYYGHSVRNVILIKFRAETNIFITKPINDEVWVYICYAE